MIISMRFAIWTGLILRLIIAVWNSYFGPSFGAELDALTYHRAAALYSVDLDLNKFEFAIGGIYPHILSVFYYLITDSLFLGSLLSCIAWLLSALLLVKIMHLLSFNKTACIKAMLIYALLPSSVLMTAVTLREPYQLLFVNLAVYSILKIYLHRSNFYWLVLFFALIGMGIFHGALLMFGIFILMLVMVLLIYRNRKRLSLRKFVFFTPLIVLTLVYGLSLFTSFSYGFGDGLDKVLSSYNAAILSTSARANYISSVVITGMGDVLLFIPIAFFQYLLEPLPWHVSSSSDVVAFLENILRVWLIWKAFFRLRIVPVLERRPVLLIFILYLILEGIWSLGTGNWGTAMRHHLPSTGLLLVAAFAYSGRRFSRRGNSIQTPFKSVGR
jgi:hypothetical protein